MLGKCKFQVLLFQWQKATGYSIDCSLALSHIAEHDTNNTKAMNLIPNESKNWSNVYLSMQCKSLWIKVSVKCIKAM